MSPVAEQRIRIDEEGRGERIDRFVARWLKLPRNRLKDLFDQGLVRLEGRRVKKGEVLEAGQEVRVLQLPEDPAVVPEPGTDLRVLWEDDDLVFLDKPAGVPCHPLKPKERGTVANALVARYPECLAASKDPREAGLCHRLDLDTSGVLLAAKNREAWTTLRKDFSARGPDKRYWTLVFGPLADTGEIGLDLAARRGGRRVSAATKDRPARPAETHFQVLARQGAYSFVEVRILTGARHQIRAHLASIGAPVVGDGLYGGRPLPDLGRLFLHARSLEVSHPRTGRTVRVECPLPEELASVLRKLGLPTPQAP